MKLLNDLPIDACGDDHLKYSSYSDILQTIIQSKDTQTPLTIGVYGGWGVGKTSLMQLLKHSLSNTATSKNETGAVSSNDNKHPYHTVWFNSWKYNEESSIWRALFLQILSKIESINGKSDQQSKQKIEDLKTSIYWEIEREKLGGFKLDAKELLKGVLETGIHVGLGFVPFLAKFLGDAATKAAQEAVGSDDAGTIIRGIERAKTKEYIAQIKFIEQFQSEFEKLVVEHGKFIILIDDLDRCLPEKVIELLEAIKLFLHVKNCVFIIGADPELIARAIELKYKDAGSEISNTISQKRIAINGKHYLEKIIQLPFHIPPIEKTQLKMFVQKIMPEKIEGVTSSQLLSNGSKIKLSIWQDSIIQLCQFFVK